MKQIILLLVLNFSILSFAAETGYPEKANCPANTSKWNSVYDGCMKSWSRGIGRQRPTQKNSDEVCKCVANGIINAPKCSESPKDGDQIGMEKLSEAVVKNCLAKVPVKTAEKPGK